MNRFLPHVYVIPEDERDRQIADGFVLHPRVDARRIQVMPVAGGWQPTLDLYCQEYVPLLKRSEKAHVVLLIDFDDHVDERAERFRASIPDDQRPRTFVIGARCNPERLRQALNLRYEDIGQALAEDCRSGSWDHWEHELLQHNEAERLRLAATVRPFLFADPSAGA